MHIWDIAHIVIMQLSVTHSGWVTLTYLAIGKIEVESLSNVLMGHSLVNMTVSGLHHTLTHCNCLPSNVDAYELRTFQRMSKPCISVVYAPHIICTLNVLWNLSNILLILNHKLTSKTGHWSDWMVWCLYCATNLLHIWLHNMYNLICINTDIFIA